MKESVVLSLAVAAAKLALAVGLAMRAETVVTELLVLSEASALSNRLLCEKLALHD